MTRRGCTDSVPVEELLAYWLDDSGPERLQELERHLFDCADCAAELDRIRQIIGGVRELGAHARFRGATSPSVLQRLERDRRVVRLYRIDAGGHVHCAAGRDDDLVVLELQAAFGEREVVDLSLHAADGTRLDHHAEVPLVRGGSVVWASFGDDIRALPTATYTVRLTEAGSDGEVELAAYTLHHSAYGA